MSVINIAVRSNPSYRGSKALDGDTYILTFNWNIHTAKWYLDLKGATNDVDIKGIALLGGRDLLSPFGYRELGELRIVDNSGANEDPNFADMGGRFTLEYTTVS